jgi:hypothetical protein
MFSGNYWELPSTTTDTAVSTLTASQMFTYFTTELDDKADADAVVSSINGKKGAVNLCVHNYTGTDSEEEGNTAASSSPSNHANLWGMTFIEPDGNNVILVDDFVGMSMSYLTTANLPSGAVSVENNFVYNYDDVVITTIRPERMVTGFNAATATNLESFVGDMPNLTDGTDMFKNCSKLATFVGDLSAMTDGTSMFQGCTLLTTFIADLSSLTNGENMFDGCALSCETALEIVESLPTYTSGTHKIKISVGGGASALLTEASELAQAKGWILDIEPLSGEYT